LIQLASCDAAQGSGEDERLVLQMFPTLCLIRPISPQRSGSGLADQRSQTSVIPTPSRIDTDNFQYEGVLSKIERVGLGEKVDAGEEEK
jgi:hypothetical protein